MDITNILHTVRNEHSLVGVTAAIITLAKEADETSASSRVVRSLCPFTVAAIGAVGQRRCDLPTAVTVDDCWQYGSNTKAMTAFLVNTHVQLNHLRWNTLIADVWPYLPWADRTSEQAVTPIRSGAYFGNSQFARDSVIHPSWRHVTVAHLLTHTSGLDYSVIKYGAIKAEMHRHESAVANRYNITKENSPPATVPYPIPSRQYFLNKMLSSPIHGPPSPTSPALTGFFYCNYNYIILGAIVEEVEGRAWEIIMAERVFRPLGMTSAGFGVPETAIDRHTKTPTQPWGHSCYNKKFKPTQKDNPEGTGPCGRVRSSLIDWAKFIALQLTEGKGAQLENILEPNIWRAVHAPYTFPSSAVSGPATFNYSLSGYGCSLNPHVPGGLKLSHSGSNGWWKSQCAFFPRAQIPFAILVLTNSKSPEATDDLINRLYHIYLQSQHKQLLPISIVPTTTRQQEQQIFNVRTRPARHPSSRGNTVRDVIYFTPIDVLHPITLQSIALYPTADNPQANQYVIQFGIFDSHMILIAETYTACIQTFRPFAQTSLVPLELNLSSSTTTNFLQPSLYYVGFWFTTRHTDPGSREQLSVYVIPDPAYFVRPKKTFQQSGLISATQISTVNAKQWGALNFNRRPLASISGLSVQENGSSNDSSSSTNKNSITTTDQQSTIFSSCWRPFSCCLTVNK